MTDRFVDELIAQRDALAARLAEAERDANGIAG